MKKVDLLVVGGGAAGMAAALAADRAGASVLLAERAEVLGGVLPQCLHQGFGLGYFAEDLTGPEYAERFARRLPGSGVEAALRTSVVRLEAGRQALLSSPAGLRRVAFSRCILATGCRERALGSLGTAGTRPAGVFTAGQIQRLINLSGLEIGENVVILGSGDIGQIMARTLAQRGKRVVMVELRSQLGGLARNRRECIEAYRIPVILRATVEEVLGSGRISGVALRHVDSGEREILPCDALVTALGLIPERELIKNLERDGRLPPWLGLCGNCESVHDIVDSVTVQGEALGEAWGRELAEG